MRKLVLLAFAAIPLFAQVTVAPPAKEKEKEARKPIVAAPAHAPGAITKFRIIATTGADDLRENSEIKAFVILKDGRRVESKTLNCRVSARSGQRVCDAFPAKSRRTVEWAVDPRAVIRPDDVHRFGLAFQTGRKGPLDSADNWDLHVLEVEYVTAADPARRDEAGTFPLLKTGGRGYVYRFKTSDSWESEPIQR